MESAGRSVGSPSGVQFPAEERMLREDVVREMLARLARGEDIKRIARELGVDRKTVKAWRARGGWRPRHCPIGFHELRGRGRRAARHSYAGFQRRGGRVAPASCRHAWHQRKENILLARESKIFPLTVSRSSRSRSQDFVCMVDAAGASVTCRIETLRWRWR